MSNDIMTPEEIERLLQNAGQVKAASADVPDTTQPDSSTVKVEKAAEKNVDTSWVQPSKKISLEAKDYFSAEELDVLGEVGNICMGTSATTMYELLGRKVSITTPSVALYTQQTLSKEYPVPIVIVSVQYNNGIDGNNLLLIKAYDVALITDLLMGGEGHIDADHIVLDEMHLSAIREVMNQMMGASAGSLSMMLNAQVNISTPSSKELHIEDETFLEIIPGDVFVKIGFKMTIEGLLVSEIMQIWPVEFAKKLVKRLVNPPKDDQPMSGAVAPETFLYKTLSQEREMDINKYRPDLATHNGPQQYTKPQVQMAQMYAQPQAQLPLKHSDAVYEAGSVDAKKVVYPSFETGIPELQGTQLSNLGILMDVPMNVTVVLGTAKKTIREVLNFNIGTVVVLDKLAGELVDVLVNGIHVAKGEVVVVGESYGVRITEINMAKLKENL